MLIRTKLSSLDNRFSNITMNGKVHDLDKQDKEVLGGSHDRTGGSRDRTGGSHDRTGDRPNMTADGSHDRTNTTGGSHDRENTTAGGDLILPEVDSRARDDDDSFNVSEASEDTTLTEDSIFSEDFGEQSPTISSPSLKINDRSVSDSVMISRPMTLTPKRMAHHYDTISIKDLTESPQRYKQNFSPHHSKSVSPPHNLDEDRVSFQPPNSPLLVAMRTAVDSLNQYEDFDIVEEIGAGFYADVFKVIHKPTGQLMVLKKSKRKTVSMLKEVELLKKLQHPNILHYVGACIHEGQLHPLTEFVNGGTLEHLIQGKKEFSWSTRLSLSLDMCKGIEYLHIHGMLHRDLNSKNVLLRKHNSKYTGVVADFGLAAKRVPPLRKLHRSQSIVGTPYWMAPEVLKGKPYNETADVFSYGIVLCEIISRLSADPDDIPRNRDFSLDVDKYQKLKEVIDSDCPKEFMELAFLSCRLIPLERPSFAEIKTRLYVIRDLHHLHSSSSLESLENDTDTIEPKPRIRLSWHKTRSPSPTQSQPSSPAILHPVSGNQTQFTLETSV